MNKLFWNDLETTGTDPHLNSIIQIACMIEENGEIVDSFESKMSPIPGRQIDPKALQINGLTVEEIMEYPNPREVYPELRKFCAKHGTKGDKLNRFIPAGYNNGFDLDFLLDWHTTMDSKYAFWDYLQFQPIDPYPVLVSMWRCGIISTKDLKLGTVCEHFGIQIDAHEAMSDIKAAREVAYRVLRDTFSGFGVKLVAF
jgi:DNA polymerase-3 subunit epsilon